MTYLELFNNWIEFPLFWFDRNFVFRNVFFLRPGFLGDSTGHRSGCTHRIVHRVFSFGFASFFSPVWFLSRVFFIVAGHRQVATRCAPGRCSRGVFNGRKIKCQKKRKKIEKETSAPKKPRTRIMADAGHTHTHTNLLRPENPAEPEWEREIET